MRMNDKSKCNINDSMSLYTPFVRRRSADIRSHAADVLRKSGDSHVHLRHRDQLMDGKQPFETQPIKDWAIMVGLVAPVETLPSRRTNHSWCSNQTNTSRSEPLRDGRRWANDGESHQPPHPHVLLSSTSTTCGEEKPNYGQRPLIIRVLVHSRLDYCNGTLAGLPQYQLNKLHSIVRASARLVLLLPGRASISSLMRVRLHWLSFPKRIKFKLCSTVYKCLHDAAPAYLSEFCVPLSSQAGHSQLRSAAAGDLLIPSTRTVTIGAGVFP